MENTHIITTLSTEKYIFICFNKMEYLYNMLNTNNRGNYECKIFNLLVQTFVVCEKQIGFLKIIEFMDITMNNKSIYLMTSKTSEN
jgi:hypothetical protein